MATFAYPPETMRQVQAANKERGATALHSANIHLTPRIAEGLVPDRWGTGSKGETGAWIKFSLASKKMLGSLINHMAHDGVSFLHAGSAYPAHVTLQPAMMPENVADGELDKRVEAAWADKRVRKWVRWYAENEQPRSRADGVSVVVGVLKQ